MSSVERLRGIPAVDRLLREEAAQPLLARYPRDLVVEAVRQAADHLRRALASHDGPAPDPGGEAAWLLERAESRLHALFRPSLRRVINATGVVLHTNLGRAVLAREALEAIQQAAAGYTNLEVDLERGERGSRHSHVRDLLTRLTGAPAALAVNNCAAAVLLAVDTLARGREVVVSRGELIEIGGSFRLPDVLRRGGARLVEVGTTNRTYLQDYRDALTDDTALLLVSHPSNYRVEGFSHRPDPAEVAQLGRQFGVPTFMDLGSGLLVDPKRYGLPPEPTVQDSVLAGFDLVAFSGDKLLGGPQAGLLVGTNEPIQALARSPLARAVRIDKLTLAALEATLRLYLDPDRAVEAIPTLRTLRSQDLPARTRRMAEELQGRLAGRATVQVAEGESSVGGGSMPGEGLPGPTLALRPHGGSEEDWAARLRRSGTPVLATCREGALRLDLRTVAEGEEPALVAALEATAP